MALEQLGRAAQVRVTAERTAAIRRLRALAPG
jgi:hypothetical protein